MAQAADSTTAVLTHLNGRFAESTTPLAAAATFTGTAHDSGASSVFDRFRGAVKASHAGTLFVEHSEDGTTWLVQASVAVAGNDAISPTFDVPCILRYQRVRYLNGATIQTSFLLLSLYSKR